ncbi:ABC transporter [Gordoniibacillus kamchatkensis]|uniref:ABC transporter n=1 Tax=Gordoniibacillus kamchatkensis TaxID=1590651 RepID=A0ABR5AA53_9BACL|nr:ABC transporter ATP-binding protein [Paenibacillus sp. VKM B-2647]KIL37850.1 ABC transporter [Paenibacillus sp. VKM B-2647]
MTKLTASNLSLAYGRQLIIDNLDFAVPEGRITVLIGANGSGKSTLLRALARLMKPEAGAVLLDGKDIAHTSTKEVARKLAMLPQGPVAPEGITVLQLVKQGRYPYQSWLQQWSEADERAVRAALEATGMTPLAERPVDALSGGQRQRAWIAMTLAQGTATVLLDEPTTYLDLTHQIEILDLLYTLNEREGRTVVMVLHDMNLACRYAHHLVAVKDRGIYAQGAPGDIVNAELIRNVFELDAHIIPDPLYGTPLCIPASQARRAQERQAAVPVHA